MWSWVEVSLQASRLELVVARDRYSTEEVIQCRHSMSFIDVGKEEK